MMILAIFLSSIFIIIGIVHISWVMGAKFAFSESIPTRLNGQKLFRPKKIETAFVAVLLLACGYFYLVKSGLTEYNLPEWIMKYGSWTIPMLFLIRAIGDFRYIGFFKQVKDTTFGKWDTNLFSPLCFVIALAGITINYLVKLTAA